VSQAGMAAFWRAAGALDRRLSQRARIPERQRLLRLAALFIAHLGDSPLWAAASAIAYWRGDARLRVTVILMAAAVLTTMATAQAVKVLARRPRPGGYSPGLYSRRMDKYSFPSGHAARVGAIAVAISAAYPHLTPAAWVYAFAVASARVALGAHYLGDVAFGLLLGSAVGALYLIGGGLFSPL